MAKYLNRRSNYDKEPKISVQGYDNQVWSGYSEIIHELRDQINHLNKTVIVVETYPGVCKKEIYEAFLALQPSLVIDADDMTYESEKVNTIIKQTLTEDPVFGVMSHLTIYDFIDFDKLKAARKSIKSKDHGVVIVYGFGAGVITKGDVLIYADLTRREIQQRYYSKEAGNWKADNLDEDNLLKFKRGYFFEWRVADRLKQELMVKMDFLLDTNLKNSPKMITKDALFEGFNKAVSGPFRVVPYFEPGIWGGQWMKEVFDLEPSEENYAWGFDCVPEENSLYLQFNDVRVEIPAINLVFHHPVKLLGNRVHARFGTEFPIRFDFLDTMDGGNLSLQVHPLVEYIQDKFGMHYTQDESYYLLDAKEDAYVYLGLKEKIDKGKMLKELEQAQKEKFTFPVEEYVNKFPAKKHDHFLIPAGTIHCSVKNCLVLEISATPNIFTFKLWDWGRLGLDGKPRPLHIEHGKKAIQFDRTTNWVKENLINQVNAVREGEGWREESTGLHEREFIETRRHWFREKVHHSTNGSVNVLNLVEGEEAIVENPAGKFEPFIIHYAETFIVPEIVKEYTIRPFGLSEGKEIATVKAYVR